MGYVKLGKGNECPAGLESPAGAEIGKKLLWKNEETHHFGFFLWSVISYTKHLNSDTWLSFNINR